MKQFALISIFLFVTLTVHSQKSKDLEWIRTTFQGIKSENDINEILAYQIENSGEDNNVIKAYKGAFHCMMANYVFSPISKLKNFNEGRKILEASILESKNVENVYLRLLIQLNVPGILNYKDHIDDDIDFLEEHLAGSMIDLTYKNIMIRNLVSVTKKEEHKDVLLQIKLNESS